MAANKLNWARHTSIDNIQDMYNLPDDVLANTFAPELLSFKSIDGEPKTMVKAVVYGSSAGVVKAAFREVPLGSQITLIGAATATENGIYIKTSNLSSDSDWKFIQAS